jgi:hypothetical protein
VLPTLVGDWKSERLRGKATAKNLKALAKAETDPVKREQLNLQAKHATL